MRIRSSLVVIAALSLPFAPSFAQQSARPTTKRAFTPADWYKLTTVSSPALSPDGKRVAFTVTTVREAENRRHSEVWVAPVTGGEPQRYTSPGTESTSPRWSPDGAWLFFNSKREGGKGSTWALRMDRPAGEAIQLDYPAGSVPLDHRFAVWSDTTAADSAADSAKTKDPFATMTPTAHPPYGAITHPVDPKRFDGRHIVDLSYKSNDRGFLPNRWTPRRYNASQLWLQRFDGSAKQQLTSTPYSHRHAVVSPDGKWIAFTADARLRSDSAVQAERDSLALLPYDSVRDNTPRNDNDVYVVPITGGTPRKIAALPGDEDALAWSPDGQRIAVTAAPARTKSTRIYTLDVRTGATVDVLGGWRYEPSNIFWLPSGDLLFDAEVGGRSAVFRVSSKGGTPVEVIGGRRVIRGLTADPGRTRLAFVSSSMDTPMEVYVSDIDGKNQHRITSFNDKVSAEIAFSNADRFTYTSVGGLEIEGWLMKPYGYQPGKKYPLVLYIHGGPHSSYDEGWFDEFQNLAGAGMFVLFTNPRGSYGYGADFTYSTRGRWGAEDYQDLMKAVDIAAARPDVDSTRMGVTGGSYGGFMTAWITGHTDRFKAAETDRMISNWNSWYGSTDVQFLTEFEFFGKPWENQALYDSLSPMRFVDRVHTPTLMIQSEEDFRAPISDAEQWYMALRKRGVPVEFVRYPRSTHELSRSGEPWLLVDRLGRIRQWFSYWLAEQRPVAAR